MAIVGLSLIASPASAVNHYVDLNSSNPVPPYSSWVTAATNIQDAIDAPDVGPFVVYVTNGIYQTGITTNNGLNRVTLRNSAVLVQSINGPAVTSIKGYQAPGTTNGASAVRCVYLASGTMLSGFTLTNGATISGGNGGGVYCQSISAVVSNCIITGNSAGGSGGGGYSGSYSNCVISGNTAFTNGGGLYGSYNSVAANCLMVGNSAQLGGGVYGITPYNCTIVGNTASVSGGGYYGTPGAGYMYNSIVYYNNSPNANTWNWDSTKIISCCTVPIYVGSGNVTNEPQFVNLAGGDFHLQAGSPCINAGANSAVKGSRDLDGNPRIALGMVDMGAYEFQSLIHYVNLNNPAPVSPYTNWPAAATNIQDAIDAANAGEFIVVSNGVYRTGGRAIYDAVTNRIVVNKAVTVQSMNGPSVSSIEGQHDFTPGAPIFGIRCAYLTNGAVLAGFTLTNGSSLKSGDAILAQSGGGIWCEDNTAAVSNCVFTGNSGTMYGGGAFRGTLLNCVLTNNASSFGGGACSNLLVSCALVRNVCSYNNLNSGGGAYFCTLSNCLIVGNQSLGGGSSGGGVFASTAYSCTLSNNFANNGGGACFGALYNCIVSSNRAGAYAGGVCSNVLNNCLLKYNYSYLNVAGAYKSTLDNCTVAANTSMFSIGGVQSCGLTNCIVYYNIGPNYQDCTLVNCDTIPAAIGAGNITNPPAFVDMGHSDFHLQTNSPCINAGDNASAPGVTDLDGNPRIIGGTADMGAYENQSPALLAYFTWLQGYGLPTDAGHIYSDSDGDGMNNWQEWIAGTDPTDPASLLKMTTVTSAVSGLTVTWQSVSGKTYFLQSSSNLTAQPAFSTIQSNIVGQAGTTSYTDTSASGPGPFFYRVGVQ
ncbi:MAG TPA: thrombospondin type 3 repeat-containing protein [Candidatus Acidoferrum sp.]|nr:thrombospondin type 3 repeat-containing protein [Candidatus Acidoferrum sp.]